LLTISENRKEKALRLTSVLVLGIGLSIKWALDLPPPLITTTTNKQQPSKQQPSKRTNDRMIGRQRKQNPDLI